jgi:hypothetical protein
MNELFQYALNGNVTKFKDAFKEKMGERFSTKKDEIKKDVLQQISPKE